MWVNNCPCFPSQSKRAHYTVDWASERNRAIREFRSLRLTFRRRLKRCKLNKGKWWLFSRNWKIWAYFRKFWIKFEVWYEFFSLSDGIKLGLSKFRPYFFSALELIEWFSVQMNQYKQKYPERFCDDLSSDEFNQAETSRDSTPTCKQFKLKLRFWRRK